MRSATLSFRCLLPSSNFFFVSFKSFFNSPKKVSHKIMSESSKSSELLFELCADDLESDDEVTAYAAQLREKDLNTRCERTYAVEQAVVHGINGEGNPIHNSRDRDLSNLKHSYLPPLLDLDALHTRGMDIIRKPYDTTSLEDFHTNHVITTPEQPYGLPFIASGAAEQGSWPALKKWVNEETISEAYGDVPLHITEVFPMGGFGKAHAIRLPLALYLKYAKENEVDFPYYPFERDFDSETAVQEGRAKLLQDFSVPKYFRDDVYALTAETRALFPKHQFVLVGGHRTGANMHQDPMGTAAWNTLIAGNKRWVFFPPNTNPEVLLTGKEASTTTNTTTLPMSGGGGGGAGVMTMSKVGGKGPVNWWLDVYPLLIAEDANGSSLAKRLGMVEVLQKADETIYTPPYWFHAVLNVTDYTIAATGNVLSPLMLKQQWTYYKKTYPQDAEILREEVLKRGLLEASDLPV